MFVLICERKLGGQFTFVDNMNWNLRSETGKDIFDIFITKSVSDENCSVCFTDYGT